MVSPERPGSKGSKFGNLFLAVTLAIGMSGGPALGASEQENQASFRSEKNSINTNLPVDNPLDPTFVNSPDQYYFVGDFARGLPSTPLAINTGPQVAEITALRDVLPETAPLNPFEALTKEIGEADLSAISFSRPNPVRTSERNQPFNKKEISSLWLSVEKSYKQLIDSSPNLNLGEDFFSADRITMFPVFRENQALACFLVLSSNKSGEAMLLKYVEGLSLEIVSVGGINISSLGQEQILNNKEESLKKRIITPSLLEFQKEGEKEMDYAFVLGDFAFFFSPTRRIVEAIDKGEKLSLFYDGETLDFGIAVLDDNENVGYILTLDIDREVNLKASQEKVIASESQKTRDKSPGENLETFEIKIAEGEGLSSVLSFYGLESQDVKFSSGSNRVTVKMSPERYNLPYKKIITPTIGMSIVPWEEEWNSASTGYGDLVAYFSHFPYTFFGHTLIEDSNLGSFAGLRNVRTGDHFFLSRSWLGENGDWLEAEVVDIIRVFSKEEEAAALSESNSRRLSFVTCLVESGNPDARLIIMARVKNYKATGPGNNTNAYQ